MAGRRQSLETNLANWVYISLESRPHCFVSFQSFTGNCNLYSLLQVSKWKLYKTARKRGIYAEIKKQNAAQALSKVPTNVQHFADLGVYKQLKKKTHLAKDALFPHLPPQPGAPGKDK